MKLSEFLTNYVGAETSVTISYINRGKLASNLDLVCSVNSANHKCDEWLSAWAELTETLEVCRVDPVHYDDTLHLLISVRGR